MRQGPDFFGDQELHLIFLARRLREALKLEDLLTKAGLDYLVETGAYTGGFLFKRELTGAYFYVAPAYADQARTVIAENRMKPYWGEAPTPGDPSSH